jgi:hypothetical protein
VGLTKAQKNEKKDGDWRRRGRSTRPVISLKIDESRSLGMGLTKVQKKEEKKKKGGSGRRGG